MLWFPMPTDLYRRMNEAGLSQATKALYSEMVMVAAESRQVGVLSKNGVRRGSVGKVSGHFREQIGALSGAGFLSETEDGEGWTFPPLQKGFDILKASLNRKNEDKERKRRQRAETQDEPDGPADSPLDGPAEFHALDKEEDKKYSLKQAANVSTGGEPSPPSQPNGWELVQASIPERHPHQIRSALAVEAAKLLRSGVPHADVTAALGLWLAKPKAGPGLLPSLVSEAVKSHAAPVQGGPVAPKLKPVAELGLDNTDAASPEKAREHIAAMRANLRAKEAV